MLLSGVVELATHQHHHPTLRMFIRVKYMDVWEVSDGITSFVTDSEAQALLFKLADEKEGVAGLTITKKKMERRKFKRLPEFDGF